MVSHLFFYQLVLLALVWSGQLLSRLGDFLYEIALAWWVLQTTGAARRRSS